MALVAVGTVELHLPEVHSLKEKRHILKGIKERVRHQFNVSIAEVDHHDTWQRAALAVACVSDDSRHANEVISKTVNFIESVAEGRVIDVSIEIL